MATLKDIGVAAGINIVTAFIFFIIFAVLRLQPFNDRVYFSKWYLKGLRSSPASGGFLNLDLRAYLKFLHWMPEALKMPERELIDHAGLDSVVYLRIYLLGLKIFAPIAILAWAVLVPVHWTNHTLELAKQLKNVTASDIDKLSVSNIPLYSKRFATHIVMAYAFTIWTCYMLMKEYEIIANMRLQFVASEARRPDQFTVLVKNVPPDPDETVSELVEHFFLVNHPDHYGGLHVIGTSLHESRRIDNQLRGRAGRQGDPGSTRFMVSLQDEMFQKFNFDTEWAVRLISKITNDEDLPIEGDTIVKQLLALQINAEKYFFGIRKSLVEFDEVLEVQRKHVYDLRQLLLTGDNESCSQHIYQYMQAVVDEIVVGNSDPHKHPRNWNLAKLLKEFMAISGNLLDDSFSGITEGTMLQALENLHETSSIDMDNFHLPHLPKPPNAFRGIRRKNASLRRWLDICSDDLTGSGRYRTSINLLRKFLGDYLIASYLSAVQESGFDDGYVKEIERAVLLKTLDCFWRDHLVNMNKLSSAVNVRSFAHRNPLEEYKIDGCRFFISMLSATRRLTIESILQYWSTPMESQELFVL